MKGGAEDVVRSSQVLRAGCFQGGDRRRQRHLHVELCHALNEQLCPLKIAPGEEMSIVGAVPAGVVAVEVPRPNVL